MKDKNGLELHIGCRVSVSGESGVGRWVVSSGQDDSGECLIKHMDSLSQLHRHPSNLTKNKEQSK